MWEVEYTAGSSAGKRMLVAARELGPVTGELVNAPQSVFMANQTNLCAHLRSRLPRNFGKIDSRIKRIISY